jgi:hypothetical protein
VEKCLAADGVRPAKSTRAASQKCQEADTKIRVAAPFLLKRRAHVLSGLTPFPPDHNARKKDYQVMILAIYGCNNNSAVSAAN